MSDSSNEFKKFIFELELFRDKFSILHKISLLLELARKQLREGYKINNLREGYSDEILYRSIIYTLFYANYLSVSLISNQERLKLGVNYIDTKIILRAIIERYITQKYILTDPTRLAALFLYWGRIEGRKFHVSHENLIEGARTSPALDMDFEGVFNEWSTESDQEYQEMIVEWEKLVQPKQDVTKAKTWSGNSLSEMARLAGIDDIYKLTYRETSWYSHGLITVSDFFLRTTEKGLAYSSSTNQVQQIECYLQTETLFLLSFKCVNEALEWNLDHQISKLADGNKPSLAWIWEFIRRHTR